MEIDYDNLIKYFSIYFFFISSVADTFVKNLLNYIYLLFTQLLHYYFLNFISYNLSDIILKHNDIKQAKFHKISSSLILITIHGVFRVTLTIFIPF